MSAWVRIAYPYPLLHTAREKPLDMLEDFVSSAYICAYDPGMRNVFFGSGLACRLFPRGLPRLCTSMTPPTKACLYALLYS